MRESCRVAPTRMVGLRESKSALQTSLELSETGNGRDVSPGARAMELERTLGYVDEHVPTKVGSKHSF